MSFLATEVGADAAAPVSWSDGEGRMAAIDARVRLAACGALALVIVSLTHLGALSAALLLAIAMATLARLSLRAALRRLAALDGFVLFALVLLPATVPGRPLASVAGIDLSAEGLAEAIRILLTSNAVLLTLLALVGDLPPGELGRALGGLGVPERLVQLLLFTVRAIDLIGREYRTLRLAMRARAFRMRTSPHAWRSIGYLFGMLLVRSLDRSERMLAAMRCRGFTGRFPCLTDPPPPGPRDAVFAASVMLAGMTLLLGEWLS